jgi:hypothetical protein
MPCRAQSRASDSVVGARESEYVAAGIEAVTDIIVNA